MREVLGALIASRKSIVGLGGLIVVGLIYFFGRGDETARSVAMVTVGGIAISIITAIGREDAAMKGNPTQLSIVDDSDVKAGLQ